MSDTSRIDRLRLEVAEVLEIDPSELEAEDNLLDHGLDSVRLMTLLETWQEQGHDPDLADLVEDPRLSTWAELMA